MRIKMENRLAVLGCLAILMMVYFIVTGAGCVEYRSETPAKVKKCYRQMEQAMRLADEYAKTKVMSPDLEVTWLDAKYQCWTLDGGPLP